MAKYLGEQKHLQRILRGIFHVISYARGDVGYSHLELAAKGLGIRNIKNWYCGLHTALKLNNMTRETFVIDDIIRASILRQNPMMIADHKFRFIKISKKSMHLGIKKHGMINSPDPEKTILDFVYLGKYNGKSNKRIIADIAGRSEKISHDTMRKYSEFYLKTARVAAALCVFAKNDAKSCLIFLFCIDYAYGLLHERQTDW